MSYPSVSYPRVSSFGIRRVPAFRIAITCALAVAVLAASIGDADARRKRKRFAYAPPFSHIVLDAKTGKALESYKADDRRYPASLTKVMTLYLLFEQMEAGKFKLDSQLKVSHHAAAQPPTKLGLKPGSTIRVDNAIKALVTKSANDIAVVVAEAIGGSEREFARMMTSKARALGMRRTVYANASGLPNSQQVTTARDQAILGRAIQWHFPRQYKYFATNSFRFRGRNIHTHNRLLGSVRGVDGIKTGYIRASGFNLVTSVRRDNRHIVAVVIGGRTGRSRDAFMRKLIREHIDEASRVRTAQPKSKVAAGAIDPDELPSPPLRPANATAETSDAAEKADTAKSAETAAATAAARLAGAKSGAEAASEAEVATVTTLGADDDGSTHDTDVTEVAAVTPARSATAVESKAAPQTPPATATEVTSAAALKTVPTPVSGSSRLASVASAGEPSARPTPVAAVVTAGLPMFPAWFPYLLVAFIGCVGSFASALWMVLNRLFPRRRLA